jgi:FAD/FMN-containing dehydrogenase
MSNKIIETLRPALSGPLITPDSAEYERERKVFNRLIDRRPLAIARCRGVADIIAVCRTAQDNGLPLAVRGGAHNVAGYGTCDDGLVADLSLMRGVRVDPVRRTARVQGGALWGDLDRESQVFGLATTGGQVSTTGVVGLTVGGGWGTLARKYGLSCDNVISADLVTVSGEVKHLDRDNEPELFWAIRGGGGNFGVISSMEFRLHPVGPVVTGGMLFYPIEQATDLLLHFRDFLATAEGEVSADVMFITAPPIPQLPSHLHRQPVAAVFARYIGPAEAAEKALGPLREFGPPAADLITELPYTALQKMLEIEPPPEQFHYWTAGYVSDLDRPVIDEIVQWADRRPDPLSMVVVIPWNGQITQADWDATSFGQRHPGWLVHTVGSWDDRSRTPHAVRWAKSMGKRIRALGGGTSYLNFTPDAGDDRLDLFYDRARIERFGKLKRQYDPSNTLRFNQNIVSVDDADRKG